MQEPGCRRPLGLSGGAGGAGVALGLHLLPMSYYSEGDRGESRCPAPLPCSEYNPEGHREPGGGRTGEEGDCTLVSQVGWAMN